MTPKSTPASATLIAPERLLPLLLVLFVASGCAALIYEIVWFQLLSLIVGSSAISMGVLLAVYMGGMCLGSLVFSSAVSRTRHPLRVYAALEVGIGLFGLIILFGLPTISALYISIGGPGTSGVIVRALFCAICLLPPTMLMGATLPAMARWIEGTSSGVAWLGFLYGSNTLGAVLGCLVAGFYLLRVHEMAFATYVAVAINAILALLAFVLAGRTEYEPMGGTASPSPEARRIPRGNWPVLVAIALSGATALGTEVIWMRLLGLLLGATTYTFSLILGAVLAGLAIGSTAGSWVARTSGNARRAFGWCQVFLMGGLAWASYAAEQSLPFWAVSPTLAGNAAAQFQLDFVRCLWAVVPAAFFWGASFPLALAAVAARGRDLGRMVGAVYAANTIGAIVGSLGVSLYLLGTGKGTQVSQEIMIVLAGAGALLLLVPAVAETGAITLRPRSVIPAVAIAALTGFLAAGIVPVPWQLVAYGRNSASASTGSVVFVGEGMNSSMAVTRSPNGTLNYHNAGKIQASSAPEDMRLQRMLGHLTTLIPDHPRSVLVIGCGAGVTAGAVSIDPAVERETIAEIEPLVPRVVSRFFGEHNFNVVDNPKVHIRSDDARHFLLTTREKFDAVTSDPFDPWVKGAATLYTKEFFDVMKEHLNPGGVVTVFVQLYETGEAGVKSEVATFLEAFPNGVVFANTISGFGYDTVMVGQVEPSRFDLDKIQARLARPEYAGVRQSLSQIGFQSATQLFATYTGNAADMHAWLATAEVNRDRNLRLQYLAGLGVNKYDQDKIYQNMSRTRRWPENLFVAAPETMVVLRQQFDSQ